MRDNETTDYSELGTFEETNEKYAFDLNKINEYLFSKDEIVDSSKEINEFFADEENTNEQKLTNKTILERKENNNSGAANTKYDLFKLLTSFLYELSMQKVSMEDQSLISESGINAITNNAFGGIVFNTMLENGFIKLIK